MGRSINIPVGCMACDVAPERLFSGLNPEAMRDLATIQSVVEYPKGTLLFEEGEASTGIFVLCSGSARLSVSSSREQSVVLRVTRPGDILGLSATISGKPHEVSAETTTPSQLFFIKRKDFMRYLRDHTEACMQVVQFLSNDVHAAYDRVRALGMARMRQSHN